MTGQSQKIVEIMQLEAQLAEKDRQIKELKGQIEKVATIEGTLGLLRESNKRIDQAAEMGMADAMNAAKLDYGFQIISLEAEIAALRRIAVAAKAYHYRVGEPPPSSAYRVYAAFAAYEARFGPLEKAPE